MMGFSTRVLPAALLLLVVIEIGSAQKTLLPPTDFRYRVNFPPLPASTIMVTKPPVVQAPCVGNPDAIICDNFETYTAGAVSPQATWWAPWAGVENGLLSSVVTTEQASDGDQSMKVVYEVQGGSQGDDQLLLLGNKSTGRYELSWEMYVPPGRAAYYNIQNSQTPGLQWNQDVYFDSTGIARVIINPISPTQAPNTTFDFPFGKWFNLTLYFDLDNNLAKLFVDSEFIYGWSYTGNLGGIDYYSVNPWDLYYVDEVSYVSLPPLTFNPDVCSTAFDITQFFGQAPGVTQTTGVFDNSGATASPSDPKPDCWGDGNTMNNTFWYTFNGDGKTYHVETVKCNAVNYIGSSLPDVQGFNPDGDTQMAVFSGDCSNGILLGCNDDLSPDGDPDWRAGLDINTEPGKTYYLLVDGFDYGNNQVATGQYCLAITQIPDIACVDGAIGVYTIDNNGFVCSGDDVAFQVQLGDLGQYVLPTIGPIYGMSWAVTLQPVPQGVWPADLGQFYISSTGFIDYPFVLSIPNTATTPQQFYVTPVVVAGATVITQANPLRMEHVSVSGADACFFVGASTLLTLLPPLNPLMAFLDPTPANNGGANNGSINVSVTGGTGDLAGDPTGFYRFEWSNGAATEDISGLGPGTYTVTISDISNCTDPLILSAEVTQLTDAWEVDVLEGFSLAPNPASSTVRLEPVGAVGEPLKVKVIDMMGQIIFQQTYTEWEDGWLEIPITDVPVGVYVVHLQAGKTGFRRCLTISR
jgi:hypothetical protein